MVRRVAHALVDLVVPRLCGGCGRPGSNWCDRCAHVVADAPTAVRPRVPLPVPVYAVGRYTGPHRRAILELKEHGRADLARPLGSALAGALRTVDGWSELPVARHLVLVPAPTRRVSARRRGGDPVTAICVHACTLLGPRASVLPVLTTSSWARDSAGLSAAARSANLAGAIEISGRGRRRMEAVRAAGTAVVLVDDVLTTGATAAESMKVLARAGMDVHLVLVIAAA
jgi:predicted amidophosphoribosyltransferase